MNWYRMMFCLALLMTFESCQSQRKQPVENPGNEAQIIPFSIQSLETKIKSDRWKGIVQLDLTFQEDGKLDTFHVSIIRLVSIENDTIAISSSINEQDLYEDYKVELKEIFIEMEEFVESVKATPKEGNVPNNQPVLVVLKFE